MTLSASSISRLKHRLGLTSISLALVLPNQRTHVSTRPTRVDQEKTSRPCSSQLCAPSVRGKHTSTIHSSYSYSHTHWDQFFVVRLISDEGQEFVDHLFENYMHLLIDPSFMFFRTFLVAFDRDYCRDDDTPWCSVSLASSFNRAYFSTWDIRSYISFGGSSVESS